MEDVHSLIWSTILDKVVLLSPLNEKVVEKYFLHELEVQTHRVIQKSLRLVTFFSRKELSLSRRFLHKKEKFKIDS